MMHTCFKFSTARTLEQIPMISSPDATSSGRGIELEPGECTSPPRHPSPPPPRIPYLHINGPFGLDGGNVSSSLSSSPPVLAMDFTLSPSDAARPDGLGAAAAAQRESAESTPLSLSLGPGLGERRAQRVRVQAVITTTDAKVDSRYSGCIPTECTCVFEEKQTTVG